MVRVIRAALPLLRQRGGGHILGVSSGLGIIAMLLIGFYCATKWAVEALHESLAQEIKAFGIKVTLIEPDAYATEFGKSAKIADGLEAMRTSGSRFSRILSTRNAAILSDTGCHSQDRGRDNRLAGQHRARDSGARPLAAWRGGILLGGFNLIALKLVRRSLLRPGATVEEVRVKKTI